MYTVLIRASVESWRAPQGTSPLFGQVLSDGPRSEGLILFVECLVHILTTLAAVPALTAVVMVTEVVVLQ